MADLQRISLDEVVLHCAELEDPRSTVNLQHPLVSVVVIALMAVLAGASGPTAKGSRRLSRPHCAAYGAAHQAVHDALARLQVPVDAGTERPPQKPAQDDHQEWI